MPILFQPLAVLVQMVLQRDTSDQFDLPCHKGSQVIQILYSTIKVPILVIIVYTVSISKQQTLCFEISINDPRIVVGVVPDKIE